MIGAASLWGLSPVYYKLLSHVPPMELLSHRIFWSLVFFALVLGLQGRVREISRALIGWRRVGMVGLAALMVSINWLLFIYATQIDRVTESSLGYYIFPLVAVLLGRFLFAERLDCAQWLAAALATIAVAVLTVGLGGLPWISLTLAASFALYGVLKKLLPIGPVVSVTCEVLMMAPFAAGLLLWISATGQGAFGRTAGETVLLMASGPITALPLILFSTAARRIPLSAVGLLQYINPTLQFLCAVILFAEPFGVWHQIAFPLIWAALTIYSIAALRQDRALRRAPMAPAGSSTQIRNPESDSSAKP